MSIFSLLVLLIWVFGVGIPVAKILGRLGYSEAWVVLAFVPLINIVALWILAYAKWPAAANDVETFR